MLSSQHKISPLFDDPLDPYASSPSRIVLATLQESGVRNFIGRADCPPRLGGTTSSLLSKLCSPVPALRTDQFAS